MNNPYDIHTWSRQYREGVLREVHTLRLERRAKMDDGRGFRQNFAASMLRNLLGLLRTARQAT